MLLPINYYIRAMTCCIRHAYNWQMPTNPCGSRARRNGLHSGYIAKKYERTGETIRQTTPLFFKLVHSLKTYLQTPLIILRTCRRNLSRRSVAKRSADGEADQARQVGED